MENTWKIHGNTLESPRVSTKIGPPGIVQQELLAFTAHRPGKAVDLQRQGLGASHRRRLRCGRLLFAAHEVALGALQARSQALQRKAMVYDAFTCSTTCRSYGDGH